MNQTYSLADSKNTFVNLTRDIALFRDGSRDHGQCLFQAGLSLIQLQRLPRGRIFQIAGLIANVPLTD